MSFTPISGLHSCRFWLIPDRENVARGAIFRCDDCGQFWIREFDGFRPMPALEAYEKTLLTPWDKERT
jgi:hypothetical protein